MTDQSKPAIRPAALMAVLFFLALQGGGLAPARAAESGGIGPRTACPRGTDQTRTMRRWPDRGYTVHLPPSYNRRQRHPVVIDLHGGGGNKAAARLQACPDQDPESPACLDRVADCEGFIVVYPDGSFESPLVKNIRTFNAGGGLGGYVCVSGYACQENIDDVRFFSDLLDVLEKEYRIDPKRVYVTGLSNGAAMSHRLACVLSERIAAIASIGGGNQYATGEECVPARSVPVLVIHGTADHCFPYDGGYERCSSSQPYGFRVAVQDTIAGWVSRNGCGSTPAVVDWADHDPVDGTTVTELIYPGCSNGGDVVLLRINGGGHTWPGGSDSLPEWITGKVSGEFSANRVMLEFFKAHPMK